jgi:ATP-dependent RNA helicase DeaD
MGEREPRDTSATTRSQSVVHYIERNHSDAARLASALLERANSAEEAPSVLVIVPSSDDALALAESSSAANPGRSITPITSSSRGRRVLSTGPRAIVGAATDLAALIGESRVNVGAIQSVAVVWPEEMLDAEQSAELEKVLGEVPRSAERLAISAKRTPALEQFLERSMWRARNIDHTPVGAPTSAAALRVLAAIPADHLRALRTILDAYDPPTTVLLTSTDEAEIAARGAAAVLDANGSLVEVRRAVPDERFALVVFFDDVPTAEVLDAAAAITGEVIAIVPPGRLAAMQRVAPNATPLAWTGALGNARSTHDALREEIRGLAGSGAHLPWVPLIEPLLEQIDAIDVAAAALSMLDRERRRSRKTTVAAAAPAPVEREARSEAFKRPRDRDDRPRGERPDRPERRGGERDDRRGGERPFGRPREGGFRGGARKFGDDTRRGPPGRDRPDRGRPGRDRPDRAREGRSRDDSRDRRGPRDDIERVPRAAHEGREWSERGERLRHSRRGPRRDEGRE